MSTRDKIVELLQHLSHKQKVSFALYCANDVYEYIADKDKAKIKSCLDMTQRWLNGEVVTKEELDTAAAHAANAAAANAAHASAHAAAHAANAAAHTAAHAAHTAHTAHTAHAAANAAHAAYTAYAAADAAANAAYAAYAAAYAVEYDVKIKQYYIYLCRDIMGMRGLELLLMGVRDEQ